MWISLLTLLLLLVTPISCRAEIRQEHGTRFRILLRIWGIPLRFDHSQAPMRPKAPSAQQLQKGKALLRALPKLKRPVRLLMRQTALEQLLVHVSIALRDPAATALTTAFLRKAMCRTPFWPLPEIPLRQIRLLIPANCREKVRIAIAPDFLHEQTVLAARCIIFLHLGTIIVAAAMALTAWKEASSWNIPSAN